MQPATPAQIDAAHPRSRGENVTTVTKAHAVEGSSPLTRGKPGLAFVRSPRPRLIPAHAGKTQIYDLGVYRERAHPRSRGENGVVILQARHVDGSSPLTRGKPLLISPSLPVSRLIPAHAGKTLRTIANRAFMTAHPRSRGENLVGLNSGPELGGSSPLTRGKPPRRAGCVLRARLIPAHAGKTRRGNRCGHPPGAHPRSRGENEPSRQASSEICGSSPLTRGKPS